MKKNTSYKRALIIFFGSFLPVFIATAVQLTGMKLPLLSPLAKGRPDVFDTIVPKLAERKNTYTLSHINSIIPQAQAAGDYDNAKAYAVIDFTNGQIIAEKNGTAEVPIASLTKIMTAVVALDLMNPNDEITISNDASQVVPTKIGVVPGEKMTVEELLNGALLTSANDAAQALKDGIDTVYGDQVFVKAMNKKAQLIGLKDSYFTNPQGFDDGHPYSSVEDLAVLSHYALSNYPLIANIVKKDYQELPENANHKQFDLYNWNGLIDVYPNTEGIKIGNTDAAGTTIAALSNRDNHKILAILLGAPGILERDMWTAELLDMSYQKVLGLNPINVTEDQLHAKYATWKYWQ